MDQNRKIDWWLFALALLVALVVRGVVFLGSVSSLAEDPDAYRHIAVAWSESGSFELDGVPTAYRPPLYPAMLRIFGSEPGAVAVLHLVAGLITVAGTFLLGYRVGLGRWSFVAAMLVAFDPILLNQSTQVMTETVATALVVLTMLSMAKLIDGSTLGWAALTGVLFGLAGLCRPELLAWGVLCVVMFPFLLVTKNHIEKENMKHAGTSPAANEGRARWLTIVVALFVVLTLMPWMIRNYRVFGRPIPTTTHGGYTLLLANNDSFYDYLRTGEWGSTWDADRMGPKWAGHARFSSPGEELQKDREAYQEAWSHIRREPGMFCYSCLIRAGRLWSLVPHQGSQLVRYAVGLWYLVLYVLAVLGVRAVWRRRASFKSPAMAIWIWGGMLIFSTTAIHTLFWSNMRMRAPLIPVLALVAAAGLASCFSRKAYESSGSSN